MKAPDAPVVGGGLSGLLDTYIADRLDAGVSAPDKLKYTAMPLKRFWGEKPPEAVTEVACRSYARERAKEGRKPGTVRTELAMLRTALVFAAKKGLIPVAPMIALPAQPAPKDRWLTRDEAARLLEACHAPHVRLAVTIGLQTSARIGAILDLTWDRVDMVAGRINFSERGMDQGRKRRAHVPINATLRGALTEAQRHQTSPWVVEFAGRQVGSIKHGFADAVARAGLTDVTPHTLRHTAATWMVQSGTPLWEVAGMLGHTNTKMLERVYGHHSPDYLANAAKALG